MKPYFFLWVFLACACGGEASQDQAGQPADAGGAGKKGGQQEASRETGQDDRKFDTSIHPWLKWQVGSFIEYTGSTPLGEVKTRETLKEIRQKGFVIETTEAHGGKEFKDVQTRKMPDFIKEDTLKIGDRTFKCTVWRWGDPDPLMGTPRIWVDEKGRFLKIVRTLENGKEVASYRAAELDAKVKVGDREYDCVRLEGKQEDPMGHSVVVTVWMSPDVPSGLVKLLMKGHTEGGNFEFTRVATRIEAKLK